MKSIFNFIFYIFLIMSNNIYADEFATGKAKSETNKNKSDSKAE